MASIQSARHPLQRLLRYGRNYRPQIWGAIANSILNTIFDLAPPYLIGIAIDVVTNTENSLIARLGITSIAGQLGVLSALTFLIWSLESLSEYIYARLWRNLAQNFSTTCASTPIATCNRKTSAILKTAAPVACCRFSTTTSTS
jgi:ATP-binding cassette, subfamily B, bacterial